MSASLSADSATAATTSAPATPARLAGGPLARLIAATGGEMAKVDALILTRAESRVELVPRLARHLLEAGGKRLRPMLTVAAALMFDRPSGAQVNYAAAIEFMHSATLLHDDVVDDSKMRRGRPAARLIWGNQASVLVGDFLLGQAFLMMVEAGELEALGVLARAAATIAEGEVFQLTKVGDLAASAEDYDRVIRAKTATLFQAALEVGAMAGGADAAGRAALRRYGLELGLAFQLADDVLDYRGETLALGKNIGDDLREGKMTLPVIFALADADADDRALIAGSLGDAAADAAACSRVVAVMDRHGALDRTLDCARAHLQLAREALAPLPNSVMKSLLSDVAEFYVDRAY